MEEGGRPGEKSAGRRSLNAPGAAPLLGSLTNPGSGKRQVGPGGGAVRSAATLSQGPSSPRTVTPGGSCRDSLESAAPKPPLEAGTLSPLRTIG